MVRQVAAYRHKLEDTEANCIEVLESHSNDSENTDSCNVDSTVAQTHAANGNASFSLSFFSESKYCIMVKG